MVKARSIDTEKGIPEHEIGKWASSPFEGFVDREESNRVEPREQPLVPMPLFRHSWTEAF
ncbi:hypothetical protein MALU111345_04945 [Marinicrinis lubricantis]